MKLVIVLTSTACIAGLGYASYSTYTENINLREQLQMTMTFRDQLQDQVETNTRQRLQFESELAALQEQLRNSGYQLSAVNSVLDDAREQINPDYDSLLQQAREEIANEQSQARAQATKPFAPYSDPATARQWASESIQDNFTEYLNTLGIPGTERQDIMEAMIGFGSQRYQMIDDLLAGNLSPEEATAIFGVTGMAASLGDFLSLEQQNDLSDYALLVKRDALKAVLGPSLNRAGGEISGVLQDQIVTALIDEMLSEQANYGALVANDGSMLTAYNNQLAAYDRARDYVSDGLTADQLAQLDRFIDNRSSGVDIILEVSVDSAGRVSVKNSRVGPTDLPQ